MTLHILLGACALAVGVFIGAVGVGGILLIPLLVYLGGVGIHTASATALFTFAFTGVLGTWLFQRRGSIDWRMTAPVCAGAVAFSVLGAWSNARMNARSLALIIAAIIIASAGHVLLSRRGAAGQLRDGRGPGERPLLTAIGAAAGFGSGLSGAGGPLFSVPLMLLAGFRPLAAVATSQALQIAAATFGTAGNLLYGHIDFRIGAWITLLELIGVVLGVRLAHTVSAEHLRTFAALLCVVGGCLMLWRSL